MFKPWLNQRIQNSFLRRDKLASGWLSGIDSHEQLVAANRALIYHCVRCCLLRYYHPSLPPTFSRIIFVLSIASVNFLLVKIFISADTWTDEVLLICTVDFQYIISLMQHWAYLDNFRGTFRWHICFNFAVNFSSHIVLATLLVIVISDLSHEAHSTLPQLFIGVNMLPVMTGEKCPE
ncbi:hypothetical protein F0562_017153 [Nyssa sinensis]|uniref:Uncharacterized protein n=1 Tax=Nyssa sinensis TaxID=561372 RepID=A0A5J4ZGA1_9ASTE|nr:hypothetical protein F0562_017153 [Nyssa sinensis]